MTFLILISFFIFATIIGSFLNVVIYRYNTGLSIAKGRSKCFSCNSTLGVKDLFPVFSYIYNKGKCRHCKSKISVQYPAVELLTGFVLTTIFSLYFFGEGHASFIGMYMFDMMSVGTGLLDHAYIPFLFLIFDLTIAALFICIGVYDMKHKIIPDGLVYTAAIIAFFKMLIALLVFDGIESWSFFFNLTAGFWTALPFALLWLVSGGRWMGLGDAKLALVIGWALGIASGFTAIIYSFWIGCICILGIMLVREFIDAFANRNNALGLQLFKKRTAVKFTEYFPLLKLKSELPFGPYMIIGFYAVYMTGKSLFGL
jgi:leader peptidase (prepilin peptidase)/N-methyltransferase